MESRKLTKLLNMKYNEAIDGMNKFGKCAIILPTGIGKTKLLARYAKEHPHKNIIFLYPNDNVTSALEYHYYDEDFMEGLEIPNVTYMSYNLLARIKEDRIKKNFSNFDVIMADECHRLGGNKVNKKIYTLFKHNKNAKLLGCTATPDRMDLKDEIVEFFGYGDNENDYNVSITSKFTLHDAIQNGIIQKPYYCYCSFGGQDLIDTDYKARLQIDLLDDEKDRKKAEKILKQQLIELANISRMDHVIRETCDNCPNNDTNYMRFIVFFKSFDHYHKEGDKIKNWFADAYPDHKVNVIIVSSEKKEYENNMKELNKPVVKKDKTIDLIYSVDKMNEGFHGFLTGIMMYRGTASSIVYSQQLGRILNTGSKERKIVFDVVDNIHTGCFYYVYGKRRKEVIEKQKRFKILKHKKELFYAGEGDPLTKEEEEDFKKLSREIGTYNSQWYHDINYIEKKDLVASGHMAKYEELIAKIVAEPMMTRIHQAAVRWVEKGGIPYDTAEKILQQKPPFHTPIYPFAKCKRVKLKLLVKYIIEHCKEL